MRKQTKIAAVVSAAALLALGASITSFAAARGTWMMVDGEWYCYDKNGDVYENTFCSSNGKEYYVGDDGMLVRSSWVEYDRRLLLRKLQRRKDCKRLEINNPVRGRGCR